LLSTFLKGEKLKKGRNFELKKVGKNERSVVVVSKCILLKLFRILSKIISIVSSFDWSSFNYVLTYSYHFSVSSFISKHNPRPPSVCYLTNNVGTPLRFEQ
jgi:hypothetical protein